MAPMWAAYTPLFSAISLDVLSWTETWRPLHGKRLSRLGMPLPTILGWICCLMVCTFKLFGFGQLFFFKLMSESVGSCYRGCWDLFFFGATSIVIVCLKHRGTVGEMYFPQSSI